MAEYSDYRNRNQVPAGVTQAGIAEAVGVESRHVPQYIRPMIDKGLVKEESAYIPGGRQHRKVYFLTQAGQAKMALLESSVPRQKSSAAEEAYRKGVRLEASARRPMQEVRPTNLSEDVIAQGYKMVLPVDKERDGLVIDLDPRRIAVLPFANMSADPRDAYLADGITEEIISTLSGVSGLSVISRTSVVGYKDTAKKVKEMGQELEVGSVLEGSLRKEGQKIRATAQLIDVISDRHVWAQSYDRQLDDVFAVQSDIARHVADALRIRILAREADRIEKKPTQSAEAYDLYLRGRYHWNHRAAEDLKKASQYFRQAVEEDPKFALGYVGLADSYLMLAGNWGIDEKRNKAKADKMLAKAAELDETLAEVHATRGIMLTQALRFREAEAEYEKAIELKPSYASAHQWYGLLLLNRLRLDESLAHLEKAIELDPLSQIINLNLAEWHIFKKDYPKALKLAKKAVELNPSSYGAHFQLRVVCAKMGMLDEMKREEKIGIRLMKKSNPNVVIGAPLYTANLIGDKKTLRRLLPKLEAHYGEPMITACWIAGVYIFLGELDKGFQWLKRSFTNKEGQLQNIRTEENFDTVREDPRYLELVKRLGLD